MGNAIPEILKVFYKLGEMSLGLFCFVFSCVFMIANVSVFMDETHLLGGLYQNLGYFLCIQINVAAILFPYGL